MRRPASFAAVAALVAALGFVGTAKADFTFPFDTDLVGYWHFDTNAGTANAVDGSGNVNVGVLQGDASRSTDIPASPNNTNSVVLDGNDDVKIADDPALDVTGALTLAAWVKRGSITDRQVIISKFNPTSDQRSYQLRFDDDSTIQLIITSNGTGALMFRTSTADFTDMTDWHHVAATYDPSGPTMTLYFDGVAQAGDTVGSQTAIFSGSADLFIGKREPAIPDFFTGKIDEVRIYDVVLDAGDIQKLARELPPSPVFPAISMTKNQVVQMNVFLALPPEPGVPCELTMSFIDESGVTFPDEISESVSETVVYGDGDGELGPDDVSTLVLLGQEAFQTAARGAKRTLFRARLSDPDQNCPPVAAVVELFDKAGKPAIVTLPPSPILPPSPTLPPSPVLPPNPVLPAFSLHKSLTAQLNVFLAVPPEPGMTCNLTMSFVDGSGVVIPDGAGNDVSKTVAYGDRDLGADQVSSLLLPGKLAVETAIDDVTSVLVRATLTAPAEDECPPVVAAVELFDLEDNQTTLVAPPSPILPPSPNLPPNPI